MTKIREETCREMFIGKRFRRWAFYFLLIFLAVMTINDVRDLVFLTTQYIENPKEANMNIVFNETITFPTMTFCMSKDQAFSHFDLLNGNDTSIDTDWEQFIETALANMTDHDSFINNAWDQRLVVKAYQAIATVNSLERELTPKNARRDISTFAHGKRFGKIRRLVKSWLNVINERNVSFIEFQQKVGIETLKRSLRGLMRLSYQSDPVSATVKVTWVSLSHLCFQPIPRNGTTWNEIEDQGEFFTLILAHNQEHLTERKKAKSEQRGEECMTLDLHGRATTLARNMEGKGRVRDGITEELCIGMWHEVRVDVRAAYVMLPNKDKPTACRNYDEDDESEFDCRSRCRMQMLQQMCLCTGLTLQYLADEDDLETFPPCDYEQCGVRAQQNHTDQLCAERCLPDCLQTRYNILVDQKGHVSQPNLTRITLIWGSFEYLKLEQQYVWNVTTFIAALGGSLGMWLGLSALSLIQFFMFLAGKVTTRVKRKITVAHPQRGKVTPASDQMDAQGLPPNDPKSTDSALLSNPFSGPVATNPFDNPFGGDAPKRKQSKVPSLAAA